MKLRCSSSFGSAIATATLEGTGLVEAAAVGNAVSSQATLVVALAAQEKAAPPFPPDFIGTTLDYLWHYDLANAAGALLKADLLIPQPGGGVVVSNHVNVVAVHLDGDPPVSVPDSHSRTVLLRPNTTYALTTLAVCTVGLGPTSPGSCTAALDPVFSFDQALFDATWGAQSFRLEDYYELAFSENFGGPVPEPGTGALLSLGLCALARMRRLAARRPTPAPAC